MVQGSCVGSCVFHRDGACFIVAGNNNLHASCYKTFQIGLTVNWPRFSPHGYGPHRRFSASLWTRTCPSSRRVRHATGSRKSSGKGMHGGRFACRGACTGLTIANVVAGCHRRTCCGRGGSRRGRCCLPSDQSRRLIQRPVRQGQYRRISPPPKLAASPTAYRPGTMSRSLPNSLHSSQPQGLGRASATGTA